MKSILILISLLTLGQAAYGSQVICETQGAGSDVVLTISSSNLLDPAGNVTILAEGMFSNVYQLQTNAVNVGVDQVEVKMTSDITSFLVTNLLTFGVPQGEPAVPQQRIIEAVLTLKSAGVAGIFAIGEGTLELKGDLSSAKPRLMPLYNLRNCSGQITAESPVAK